MNFTQYQTLFEAILNRDHTESPYDNEDYFQYTKMNASRQNRWLKRGEILAEVEDKIKKLGHQKWELITEPWCGDASHSVPFIQMLASLNDKIELNIQLRDAEDSEIENYLTNGGKSIPKLIARNEAGEDVFVWGPRPKECQQLMQDNKAKNLTQEEQKIALQKWYNEDKGSSLQKEIFDLI